MGIGEDLIGGVEQLLVAGVIRRRALFRMTGPASQSWRAETQVERMHPGSRCLLVPSATIGLAMILEALDVQPGQEVLIAPFGWVSNWSCIVRAGLVPRFVPLDADLQMHEEDVAARISERTGAIVVTHQMGRGQQAVGEIARLAEARGIPLLEDIAQSFGVMVRGRRVGTFGEAAWCSLNHHKILSTGDGGFVLLRDEARFDRVTRHHDQGMVIRNGKRRPLAPVEPGLSLRVNELTAAVLRAQLARFHLIRTRILAHHAAVASACSRRGLDLIPAHSGDIPFTVLFRRPDGWRYPTLCDSGWHLADNVPWLSEVAERAAADDPAVAATFGLIGKVSAVGAGFIDPYYAIPAGLRITDDVSGADGLVGGLEDAS